MLFAIFLSIFILQLCPITTDIVNDKNEEDCASLMKGEYICPDPKYDHIDHKTQQPKGCTRENKAKGQFF